MHISDLISELEQLESVHGDLIVELDSGKAISDVDVVFSEDNHFEKPVSVSVK